MIAALIVEKESRLAVTVVEGVHQDGKNQVLEDRVRLAKRVVQD